MRLCLSAAFMVVVMSAVAPLHAAERLAGTPAVAPVTGGYALTFRLTRPADVTVRIVDAKGNVVRHLACGMVGLERAAMPFTPKTLMQKITWDGKNNAGKRVDTAGCRATIGVGIRAKFDRFILWERDACARSRPNLYHTAANGETYVIQISGVHLDTLRLFDAGGKFVREVWPPSLDRPAEAVERLLKGRWGATDWDGDGVPIKVCMNSWYLFGTRSPSVAVTTDGYLVGRFSGVGRGVYAIDPDGYPHAWRWRPSWYVRQQTYRTNTRIAAGADGDFYYTDNYHHVVGRFRAKDMSPVASFTHNGAAKLDEPRFYLGEMDKPGDDAGHFKGPDDVALDAEGNLCVLDGGKTKVYDTAGRFLKEAGKDDFPAARPVPKAVTEGEKTPRALCFPRFLDVRSDGRLFIMNLGRDARVIVSDVDGKTFETFKQPWACNPYHGYSAFDDKGNWYVAMRVHKQPQQIWKYDRDGKRAKFGERDAIPLGEDNDPFRLNKGLFVANNGDIYVVTQKNKWTTKPPAQTARLVKFSPEGGVLDDKEGRSQLWNYAGVSGVSPWNCDAECPAAQICIDPDERLWVSDSFLYCVKAVDKAGNEMIRVGKYGNEDSGGGGGDRRHPQLKNVVVDPEVPLAYPKGIAVYKDYLLISDMYAHRVMRCRLEYELRREIVITP